MKGWELSTIGGTAKGVKVRKAGDFTILEFRITKSRKRKGETQYTSLFCSMFAPKDWMLKAITEGATVIVEGETWERKTDEKIYRSFEVNRLIAVDSQGSGGFAPESHGEPRSIQEPMDDATNDDLPF